MQSVKAFICESLDELADEIDLCASANNLKVIQIAYAGESSALVLFEQK